MGIPASRGSNAKLEPGSNEGTTGVYSTPGVNVMLHDIVEVRYLGDHRLFLRFEDGVEGELDVASIVEFEGILEPLRDTEYFSKVSVHPELGTIVWPNGADIDPVVLYHHITGEPIPDFDRATAK